MIEDLLLDDPTAEEVAYYLDGIIPGESTILLVGPPWYSGDALTRRGDITVLAVDTPVGYGFARARSSTRMSTPSRCATPESARRPRRRTWY